MDDDVGNETRLKGCCSSRSKRQSVSLHTQLNAERMRVSFENHAENLVDTYAYQGYRSSEERRWVQYVPCDIVLASRESRKVPLQGLLCPPGGINVSLRSVLGEAMSPVNQAYHGSQRPKLLDQVRRRFV